MGHLNFPLLPNLLINLFIVPYIQAGNGECNCGGKMMKGLCVKPVKGDAVLFWSMVCLPSNANSVHVLRQTFCFFLSERISFLLLFNMLQKTRLCL